MGLRGSLVHVVRSGRARPGLVVVVVLVLAALLGAGPAAVASPAPGACGPGAPGPAAPGPAAPGPAAPAPAVPAPAPAPIVLPILPARAIADPPAGAVDVPVDGRVSLAVGEGRIDTAALTDDEGRSIAGALAPDGRRWTAATDLDYGRTYTWSGSATGWDGAAVPLGGTFRTLDPAEVVRATFLTADGATVGVAQPVVLQFAGTVTDRAAVQRALHLTTSVPTEGSWAWLPDTAEGSRVHWRPRQYWRPGTQVSVTADLHGLALGGGAYGEQDLTSHMTIGRSQITRADVNSHRIVVERDGQQVLDLPASYGLGEDPRRNTRNGVHVVMSKEPEKVMSNPTFGYTDVHVVWATRISNNGEYIHANPATVDAQGQDNVTHGCVNLSVPNAEKYYDEALVGDPVEVTGSPITLSAQDGDIYDWAVAWDDWTRMSAASP